MWLACIIHTSINGGVSLFSLTSKEFLQIYIFFSGFWVPGPPPLLRDVADLKFVSQQKIAPHMHRLSFVLTGSYMMSLQIRLKDSVQLKNWTISNRIPPEESIYNKNKAYFVMISHGLETEPLQFSLDLKVGFYLFNFLVSY